MSRSNLAIVAITILLSLSQFISLVFYISKIIKSKTVLELTSMKNVNIARITSTLSVITTTSLSMFLAFFVNRHRKSYQEVESIANKLVIYIISTGFLAGACQFVAFISSFALPRTFWYIAPFFVLPKRMCSIYSSFFFLLTQELLVYVNSILAMWVPLALSQPARLNYKFLG